MGQYAQACRREIGLAVQSGLPDATSVFFGGGTPSLLPGAEVVSILAAIPRTPDAEVTVECNPETVTAELMGEYRAAGVNRLSFGVQSMVPHVLTGLGRLHDPVAVYDAVAAAVAAGFANWNLDLIYGGSGEHDRDWQATLDAVCALKPPPVSAYALTVEPGTPLASDPARHPDDDVQATRYLVADGVLSAAGLENYEISNWARPGHRCRHNLLYWDQGDYRGFGCAAHSHVQGRRWWNVRTPERYIAAVEDDRSPVGGEEVLDAATRRRERAELSLRTWRGIGTAALAADDREAFSELGLIRPGGDGLVLTPQGRLLANEVAVRLVDHG